MLYWCSLLPSPKGSWPLLFVSVFIVKKKLNVSGISSSTMLFGINLNATIPQKNRPKAPKKSKPTMRHVFETPYWMISCSCAALLGAETSAWLSCDGCTVAVLAWDGLACSKKSVHTAKVIFFNISGRVLDTCKDTLFVEKMYLFNKIPIFVL